jgi:hypothetical protein
MATAFIQMVKDQIKSAGLKDQRMKRVAAIAGRGINMGRCLASVQTEAVWFLNFMRYMVMMMQGAQIILTMRM